jgi:hypothetical protein
MTGKLIALAVIALLTAFASVPARADGDEVEDGPVPARNEVVMTPRMKITATTPTGKITITADKRLKRSYTWEGATRSVEMWPRDDRWYGSLGLYFPGPGEHWKNHKDITRGVVEEGQQHFKTAEEALKWLGERKWMPYVYRDDGLVVGWSKTPARRQLNVEVWQILINGKKPVKLRASQDDKIKVEQPKATRKGDTKDGAAAACDGK